MSKDGTTWTHTYNADGLRTKRTNGSTTYTYVYDGGTLVRMTENNNRLFFSHSPDGVPLAVVYKGDEYYYVTNAQGDVIALLDVTGNLAVEYTYDAWGKVLSITGPEANTIGRVNPLRYRGYVYDQETELYYLQSRYYAPHIGRFINADVFASTGQGFVGNNMYAYCLNNPAIYRDTCGTAVETVFDIISLGASVAEVAINPADPWAWIGLIGDLADVALPCVGGLGEAVKVLRAANVIDDSVDLVKVTENTLKVISDAARIASLGGTNSVYVSYKSESLKQLEYVGITNDFDRRYEEWKKYERLMN